MAPPSRDSTDSALPVQATDGIAPPAIALPTGGGALRSIGETFSVNPVTGTSSIAVPLAITPGRSGFSPSLAVSYDSGSGNGPFGLGWSLSLPAISRKTEKALPRYHDAADPDIFVLSGTEDLVPVLTDAGTKDSADFNGYRIERYWPRIEGLFARVERWTQLATGEIHWRSVTRENVTTLYGQTLKSRIADPAEPGRIFKWLIDETRDDRGNVIVYEYKAEDLLNVDATQCHEQNRKSPGPCANRYLKYVYYGNHTPHKADAWHFQLVFDYGEHELDKPTVTGNQDWPSRLDPFSTYRSGFEVRTYRLCRRVLMFHAFDDLPITPCLVRSTDFQYREDRVASVVTAITHTGYVRDGGEYHKKSMPPVEFTYTESVVDNEIHVMTAEDMENAPSGVDGNTFRWVDLDGEGLTGALTQQGGAWRYNRNRGGGKFGGAEIVAEAPSPSDFRTGYQLLDLANEGLKSLVRFAGPLAGYSDRTADGTWEPFKAFSSLPNIAWDDPNVRFLDVDGDGLPDILMSEEDVFSWFPSEGKNGFGPRAIAPKPRDAEAGAALVFADAEQSVYTADMSGDGLVDIVRIRNGEVCYWPNLGYGRFGAKVTMDDAPVFDFPDQFSQGRIRLVDIDGSGTTDIIYLGRAQVRFWINQCGNRWSQPQALVNFPKTDDVQFVAAVDLLGNGTACLVWSSPLPIDVGRPLRYLDLTSGFKPHLLASIVNNLGAETRLQYAPSTKFYLEDLASGHPWAQSWHSSFT